MRRGDMPEILRIMSESGDGETDKRLNALLEKSSVMCVVAEMDEMVAGVAIYDVARVSKLKVLSIVVDEPCRRKGVGRMLAEAVVSKLNKKRNKAELSVSEYNLPAQLFLRSLGFRAVSVVGSAGGLSEYKFMYKFSEAVGERA